MAVQCPYLEHDDALGQEFAAPSAVYRCALRHPPERVGVSYQREICLTIEHKHCHRLALIAPVKESFPDEAAQWARPAVRRPELQRAPRRKSAKSRRPLTLTEIIAASLCLGIILTVLFIGYAIGYRLWMRTGVLVPPVAQVTGGPVSEWATLVPTFTPTTIPAGSPVPVATEIADVPVPVPGPSFPTPVPETRVPATMPPTRLVIPKISLDIPVQTVGTKIVRAGANPKVVWADIPNAGGFHETSAYPGNPGNTVINGHRDIQGSVFRHLNRVGVGDEILLYVGDTAYPYFVTEIMVLPETFASAAQRAENLEYIREMPEERLTLVTCTPVGLATHRLLVIAKPPESASPQMPEAGLEPGS